MLPRRVHVALLITLVSAGLSIGALTPAARAAEFGATKWEAATCTSAECKDSGSPSEFYTQAAGHPDFGITDFAFGYEEVLGAKEPVGNVKDVRVDLPPGLAVNPEATGTCTEAQLDEFKCPAESQVGVDDATGTAELVLGIKTNGRRRIQGLTLCAGRGKLARFAVGNQQRHTRKSPKERGTSSGELFLEGGIS